MRDIIFSITLHNTFLAYANYYNDKERIITELVVQFALPQLKRGEQLFVVYKHSAFATKKYSYSQSHLVQNIIFLLVLK